MFDILRFASALTDCGAERRIPYCNPLKWYQSQLSNLSPTLRLNSGQFAHAGMLDPLRAAPDQKEQCFPAPSSDGMAFHIASPFGGRQRGLGASQHQAVGACAKRFVGTNRLARGNLQQVVMQVSPLAAE